MGVFDNILKSDQSLFKNIDALDFAFVPKIVPYREEQQRRIASGISPLFSDRNGKNLVLYGMPGVGKTVACRHVLQELSEKTEDIMPMYVNCWQKNTSYKVVLDICEVLGYRFTQNKKTDELFGEIVKLLNKRKVVFVFDEIDKAEDYDFLYVLMEEVYRKSFILITNFRAFLDDMDDRVKSRLLPELVEFRPYNLEETRGILKDRIRYAFFPNVWETDSFEAIVKKAAEMQDIRAGIQLLKDSGDIAEGKASKKILASRAQEALSKVEALGIMKSTDLTEDDQRMLDIIKKNPKGKIGDLFEIYCSSGGKAAYKTFQRKMKNLQELGFVKLTKSDGSGGNTTFCEYIEKTKLLTEY
jgi:archaeal cell division control protein 6